MGDWANDVRYGVRMILKRPGTSAIAIVALGLGIGLTTVMFSIVEGVMLRGLPFEGGDRIMSLSRDNLLRPEQKASVPVDDFLDWQARQQSFEGLAAYTNDSVILSGDAGFSERYDGERVSPNTMSLLHVRPVIGRDFVDADTAPGAPAVLLLGHGLWMSRYGGDPAVVGRTLQADGTPAIIIGVMPEKFAFPSEAELWRPLSITAPVKRGAGASRGRVWVAEARRQHRQSLDGIDRDCDPARARASGESEHHRELRPVRRAIDSGARAHDARDDARRGVRRDADRVRERDESAAGARHGARERSRDPQRARIIPLANRPAAARRRTAAVGSRIAHWPRDRPGRRDRLHARDRRYASAVLDRRPARSRRAAVRGGHHRGHRARLERDAGLARRARRRECHPQRRDSREHGPADGRLQPLARRHRSHGLVRAADRVGSDDSQHSRHQPARLSVSDEGRVYGANDPDAGRRRGWRAGTRDRTDRGACGIGPWRARRGPLEWPSWRIEQHHVCVRRPGASHRAGPAAVPAVSSRRRDFSE